MLPFPIDPELQAIAIAYKNPRLIADRVLPRVVVGREEFKYFEYPKEEAFTIPDTKVGRRSAVNKVKSSATEQTDSTEDYGLEEDVPQHDIDNAPENYDPQGRATERNMNLILLAREKRVADTVFDATAYGANNKIQLAGTDQWSDHANSDPIGDIMFGLDQCIFRPNTMTIGRAAFTQLAQHPDILKAINRTAGDTGVATREAIAALFELDEVNVGEGWVNTAKPGQDPNIVRVWGKHCLLHYTDPLADTRGGITFGFTAQFGDRHASQRDNPDIGLDGGVTVRSGEKVKEKIVAADVAYFIEDAVA